MSEPRPDISPSPSQEGQQLPLEDFLDALRREGFAVDADHYHEVPQLLNTLAAEHTFEELQSLLAPLFARNRQEQQRFYAFFRRYFEIRPARVATPPPLAGAPEPIKRVEGKAPEKSKRNIRGQLLAGLAIILVLGLVYTWYTQILAFLTNSKVITVGLLAFLAVELKAIHNVLKRRLKGRDTFWYGALFIGVFLGIMAFVFPQLKSSFFQEYGLYIVFGFAVLLLPLNWYWSRPEKAKAVKVAPPSRLIAPLRFPPDAPFPRLNLIGRTEAFHISRHLNRLQADSYNTREIDIPATLERTVRNAGIIDIAFQQVATRPHYLLLIDAANANEHEIEWFDYLLQVLQGDETRLERYFFEHDPGFCWLERGADAVPLQNLYGGQRLIILSDGYSMADPVSGGLFNWVLGLFSLWTEKALLSFRPVEEWGYFEQQLSQEFYLAPSTIDGLMEAVGYFDNYSDKSLEEWHRDNIYDVLNTDDVGLIRRSMPAELFEWLCACALYPELHWKLTLYLGDVLEQRPNALLNPEHLTRLNRLKWLREGQIPDQARTVLVQLLPEAAAAKAHQALAKVLARPGSAPPEHSYAYRVYRQHLLLHQFEVARVSDEAEANALFRQLQLLVAERGAASPEVLAFVREESRRQQYGLPLDQLTDSVKPNVGLLSQQAQEARLCWALYRGGESLRITDHLEERLQGAEKILLLIPGIEDSKQLVDFARTPYLEQEFDAVLSFEYNRLRTGLDESAQMLKKLLSEAGLEQEGQPRLSILAHSTGGLVARYYIEQLDGVAFVAHLVMTGTPNGGARLLAISSYSWTIMEGLAGFLPFIGSNLIALLRRFFNRSFSVYQQVTVDSDFLRRLNRQSEEVSFEAESTTLSQASFQSGPFPGIPYSIVAGNAQAYYEGKKPSWIERFAMGLLAGIYNNKPHDLNATVESIRSIGDNPDPKPAFREVAATHVSYYREESSVQAIRELMNRDLTIEQPWEEIPAAEAEAETGSEAPEAEAPEQEAPEEQSTDDINQAREQFLKAMEGSVGEVAGPGGSFDRELRAALDSGPGGLIALMRRALKPDAALHSILNAFQARWDMLQKQRSERLITEPQFNAERESITFRLTKLISEQLSPDSFDLRAFVQDEPVQQTSPPPRSNRRSRWVLFSGIRDVPAEKGTTLRNAFMEGLFDFLRRQEAPYFPASELLRATKNITPRSTAVAQLPDGGPLGNAGDEGGEFIFYNKRYLQSQAPVYQQQNAPAFGSGQEPLFRGRALLLAIGISKYFEFPPLLQAVRETRELTDILTKMYQFEPQDTFILYDTEATRGNIFSILERVTKEAGPDDEVLLFFSGHGQTDIQSGQSYWLPADAKPGSPESYIYNDEILRYINSMAARHVLIIADAPFSGMPAVR